MWSPDGTKIGFSDLKFDTDGGVTSIVTIADLVAGTVVSTGIRGHTGGISNEYVTFTFVKGMTNWVGVARHDGSNRVDLAFHADSSSLSSDGSQVLFRVFDTINIINRDGSGRRTLIQDPRIEPQNSLFAGGDRYVVYQAHRGDPGRKDLFVFARRIDTGEETNLGQGGLQDVVGDWVVIDRGGERQFAVSLDNETRFELPWRERGWAHGDLSTLAPSEGGEGDGEPRAVYATGKALTTWARLKAR
ncbi:MAG: hypothetical protein O3A46_11125 [Candidatus Poribacteria bacterium]|nr:hypothetical protein [Candidatus Poribacteria bacterium]